jgi:DNA repair exonuclease SbcCD ATPase subunit
MAGEAVNNIEFSIPERFRPGLVKLVTAEDDVVDKLLDSLENSPPTLHSEDMASFAAKKHNIEAQYALEVLRAVLSLYSLQEKGYVSTEQLVQQVSRALHEGSDEALELSNDDIARFQRRLSSFLEIRGSLEISSKASDLLVEYENIFSNARVVTDIRPIFKPDIEDGLGGALIVHSLRIAYKTTMGTHEFYVALEPDDVEQLLEDLDRALQKQESLKSLLKKVELPYLGTSPNFDD